ncbi:hypothetical protein BELL_0362g00080 [Botrytis elliptica]|uniref:Uncharacterized protein n=1 Tax=Botrytis elliptica TaxID=278938 RepID=A0A4Z1JIV2_9HELO|nr:hypothetical protein BELL_0362g00080 [Botrytis elliptica]
MAGQSAGSPKIQVRPRTKPIIVESESHHVLPSHWKPIILGLTDAYLTRMQQYAKSNVAGGIQGISKCSATYTACTTCRSKPTDIVLNGVFKQSLSFTTN